jgi:hypothetical protein
MNCLRHPILNQKAAWLSALTALLLTLAGCTPTPTGNVLAYLVIQQTGARLTRPVAVGTLTGRVTDPQAAPLAGATVVVALATGEPFTAVTDRDGRYRIEGVPVGYYVPAAVAPGYDEGELTGLLGWPKSGPARLWLRPIWYWRPISRRRCRPSQRWRPVSPSRLPAP